MGEGGAAVAAAALVKLKREMRLESVVGVVLCMYVCVCGWVWDCIERGHSC